MKEIGRYGIEAYFKRAVKAAGGATRKWVSPGRPNVPDQIAIWPGARRGSKRLKALVHFVELKAPGEVPTDAQHREHERLRAMGCDAFWFNDTEKIDDYVEVYK